MQGTGAVGEGSEGMRIAIVSQPWDSVIPATHSGSISIITYQLARRLARSAEVVVYAREEKGFPREHREEGVLYRRVSTNVDVWMLKVLQRLSALRDPKRPLFSSALYHLGYILQVANGLRRQGCDVVHIHQFSQFVPIVRALNPKARIVLHMNCEWLSRLHPSMIERRLCRADLVIGCSDYITDRIRRAFPQYAGRCQTLYNGVDVDCFAPGSEGAALRRGGQRLLYAGRVSPEKGLHTLLDTFGRVLERYPQTELEIAGPEAVPRREFFLGMSDEAEGARLGPFYSGSYLSQLKGRLTPGMAGRVSFAGNIPHSQMAHHYRNADILVFPSALPEPFGIPAVEAMACKLPVVATRDGGMPEIVEGGVTGFLVDREDAGGLARAILRLLESEELRRSMGEAGYRRAVQSFSWDRIAGDLLSKYESLCQDGEQMPAGEVVVSSGSGTRMPRGDG